ncbi:hypothetical protein [Gorillibacterium massiliense]|uniref:prenylated flavin chaperone LpdD n=1 Tax=Gorillibacterium massiliense TaxID=1280390 RepID=UPI0004B50C03|nr:hypothetical protein [Gorillibacterium massiliense]
MEISQNGENRRETPFQIQVRAEQVGRDYLFIVTGGEAHIGAVATAYLNGEGATTILSVVPGHREDQLVQELAERACLTLSCTATVVAGIHIEKATKEEIKLAVQTARNEMDRLLEDLASR